MSRKAKEDRDGGLLLGGVTRLANQAKVIVLYSVKWASNQGAEYHIRSLSIYPPTASRNGQWLVIAKAWYGGYRLVAFHRSPDMLTALAGILTRWWQGKLDWKHDEYADKGTG